MAATPQPNDPKREKIHDLLQEIGPFADPCNHPDCEHDCDGAVDNNAAPRQGTLVGWAMVCDWVNPETGERFLTTNGAAGMPWWQVDGLMHASVGN